MNIYKSYDNSHSRLAIQSKSQVNESWLFYGYLC